MPTVGSQGVAFSYERGTPVRRAVAVEATGKPASKKLQDVEWVDLGSTLKLTRWSSRVSLPDKIESYVTNFAPHKALKSVA